MSDTQTTPEAPVQEATPEVQGETQATPEAPTQPPTQAEIQRAQFVKGVELTNTSIPPEFNGDAGAYYDYMMTGQKPEAQAEAPAQETPPTEEPPAEESGSADGEGDDELQIELPPEEPETAEVSQEQWDSWGSEILSSGELSEETRTTIKEQLKVPDFMIDQYLDLFKVQMDAQKKQAYDEMGDVVGSREEVQNVLKWASNNLDKAEITAINLQLLGPRRATVMAGLKARYDASTPEVPNEPKRPQTVASTNAVSGIEPYRSVDEMKRDVADPRYRTNQDGWRDHVNRRQILTHQKTGFFS